MVVVLLAKAKAGIKGREMYWYYCPECDEFLGTHICSNAEHERLSGLHSCRWYKDANFFSRFNYMLEILQDEREFNKRLYKLCEDCGKRFECWTE